jgi:excisionase family DNA binding protein
MVFRRVELGKPSEIYEFIGDRQNCMEDRWLSVEEISAYLGVKRDTVYTWRKEKDLPAHKFGRLWKFRREEVDEWIRSCPFDKEDESSMTTGIKG